MKQGARSRAAHGLHQLASTMIGKLHLLIIQAIDLTPPYVLVLQLCSISITPQPTMVTIKPNLHFSTRVVLYWDQSELIYF